MLIYRLYNLLFASYIIYPKIPGFKTFPRSQMPNAKCHRNLGAGVQKRGWRLLTWFQTKLIDG